MIEMDIDIIRSIVFDQYSSVYVFVFLLAIVGGAIPSKTENKTIIRAKSICKITGYGLLMLCWIDFFTRTVISHTGEPSMILTINLYHVWMACMLICIFGLICGNIARKDTKWYRFLSNIINIVVSFCIISAILYYIQR